MLACRRTSGRIERNWSDEMWPNWYNLWLCLSFSIRLLSIEIGDSWLHLTSKLIIEIIETITWTQDAYLDNAMTIILVCINFFFCRMVNVHLDPVTRAFLQIKFWINCFFLNFYTMILAVECSSLDLCWNMISEIVQSRISKFQKFIK